MRCLSPCRLLPLSPHLLVAPSLPLLVAPLPRLPVLFDGGRAEGDARRAGLQGEQVRLAVRSAFGADGDGAAAAQKLGGALEGLAVARGVRALVLFAIDGDGVERADEERDDGHREERRLCEEGDRARREAEEEDRVNKAVRMVEDEEARATPRHALAPHHLDAAEEDAQREPQHDRDDAPQQVPSEILRRKLRAKQNEKSGASFLRHSRRTHFITRATSAKAGVVGASRHVETTLDAARTEVMTVGPNQLRLP